MIFLGFPGFSWILLDFARFFWIFLDFASFSWILLDVHFVCQIFVDFATFSWFLLDFPRFCRFLRCCPRILRDFPGFAYNFVDFCWILLENRNVCSKNDGIHGFVVGSWILQDFVDFC